MSAARSHSDRGDVLAGIAVVAVVLWALGGPWALLAAAALGVVGGSAATVLRAQRQGRRGPRRSRGRARSRPRSARVRSPAQRTGAPPGAGFAELRDVRHLVVRGPPGDRVVLGEFRRRLIAAEEQQSLLVVGPSQSGKTTGLAIPAICEWAGPVVATSVKADLVRETLVARSELGEVAVFDPTRSSGLAGAAASWSPLSAAATWRGARRVAESLCSVGRSGGIDDADFWYSSAERLLAPLLLAAATAGLPMAQVVAWLDEQAIDDALLALELAGERDGSRTLQSCGGLEERQRSSVFSTAQAVIAAYADPDVAASEHGEPKLDASWVLDGGPARNPARTLYCSAPARDQQRLSPVFVALVRDVIDAAFERSSTTGAPLDPPLLVLLDEAANIAPLPDLDRILATAAGHGVVVVTIWQDLAQVEARFGSRWATIVNNHRARLVFPGVADPRTLELLSALIGDEEASHLSETRSRGGEWSETRALQRTPVAPPGWIRRLDDGSALVIYGRLPPVVVRTRRR